MDAIHKTVALRAIAPGEEETLARLFQLYCYDNAGWSGEALLADCRYDVCDAGLASYVDAAGHTAHWIEVDGALPQQVVGNAQQFAVMRVGGLLPVGFVLEQTLPGVEVRGFEVVAHGALQ